MYHLFKKPEIADYYAKINITIYIYIYHAENLILRCSILMLFVGFFQPLDTEAGLPEVLCIVSPVDAFSMYNDVSLTLCSHMIFRNLLIVIFSRKIIILL